MKKQKWILLLAAAVLLLSLQLPVLAVDFGDSLYAPVALCSLDETVVGNGMIVSMTQSTTYILTDSYFISQGEDEVILFPTIYGSEYVECNVVWEDSYGYLVLLSTDTVPAISDYHKPVTLQPLSAVSAGEKLYRVFINLSETDNPSRVTTYEACYYQATAATGTSENILLLQDNMQAQFQLGCPVLDQNGNCAAVSGLTLDANGDWITQNAVGLDEVISVLQSNGIPYNQQDSSSSSSGGQTPSDPSSSGGQTTSEPSSGTSPDNPSGDDDNTSDIIKGGLIGLVCAVGAYVFWQMQKKKNAGTVAAAAGQTVPVLVGVGGMMNGCRFPLSTADLRIGRDPSQCAVVYPPQQPGISSCHCQIVQMNGQWLLIDMGSTHGTFVNGQRLEPGRPVPLANGGVFFLAGQENSFRFEEG